MSVTAELVRDLFIYDPDTGLFSRRKDFNNGQFKAGDRVGYPDRRGRLRTTINGRAYFLHRLAWLYVYGEWPKLEIDHINVDCMDNRIANLREATHSQNLANRPGHKNTKTGLKGVTIRHGKYYTATIIVMGKHINLGSFKSKEEAAAAYARGAVKHFGEFARIE